MNSGAWGRVLQIGAAVLAWVAVAPHPGHAWPDRTIQLVVGFPPGGVVDVMARSAAGGLAQALGQAVVVVNKDGAGGTIAAAYVANAPPDGYTIAFSALGPLNLQPHLRKTLPYKPQALVGICQAFYNDLAVVATPTSRFKTLADVVAEAKRNPDRLTYGVPGQGTTPHIAALQLEQAASIKMQSIAYRGDPAVTLALKSGEIELGFIAPGSAVTQGLRMIAVLAPSLVKEAPGVPTAGEAGYPVSGRVFGGLYGPRDLPAAVRGRLEGACKAAVASDKYVATAKSIQTVPLFADAEAFNRTIATTSEQNRDVIRAANLTLD